MRHYISGNSDKHFYYIKKCDQWWRSFKMTIHWWDVESEQCATTKLYNQFQTCCSFWRISFCYYYFRLIRSFGLCSVPSVFLVFMFTSNFSLYFLVLVLQSRAYPIRIISESLWAIVIPLSGCFSWMLQWLCDSKKINVRSLTSSQQIVLNFTPLLSLLTPFTHTTL